MTLFTLTRPEIKVLKKKFTLVVLSLNYNILHVVTRELEREEKKLELEIKKAAKMGNKQVMIYYYLLK